ncbi:putative tubby-like protein [Helianthus anomalus]
MVVRIVKHAMETIHLFTDANPIQIILDLVINRFYPLQMRFGLVLTRSTLTVFTLKSLDRHLRVLHDEDLKLIAVLSKEKLTLHSRWSVSCLSGESKTDLKIVCSVCKHRIIQSRVNLNATLEKEIETRIRAAAFKVTGSWEHKRCIIYEEDPTEIIAEVMTPLPLENDKFMVEVRAGVDCAFVVSLMDILIAMKTKSSGKKKGAGLEAGKVALQFVCGVAFGVVNFCLVNFPGICSKHLLGELV